MEHEERPDWANELPELPEITLTEAPLAGVKVLPIFSFPYELAMSAIQAPQEVRQVRVLDLMRLAIHEPEKARRLELATVEEVHRVVDEWLTKSSLLEEDRILSSDGKPVDIPEQ